MVTNIMTSFQRILTAAISTVLFASAGQCAMINLTASIDGAQANAGQGTGSPGIGSATMTLDDVSNEFAWTISWSGLVGTPTVAHFHGPAAPDVNAGVQVPFDPSVNPSVGSSTITAQQAADLLAELWYINIHTTHVSGGEIRGQVTVVPEPAATAIGGALAALGAVFVLRRQRTRIGRVEAS
jgi:hypothetical protein